MDLSIELIALVAATFIAAGFVKGTIGLGLPTVTLAVLTLPLGLQNTLAILLLPLILTNVWQALSGPHLKTILKRLWPYLLTAIITVSLGVHILEKSRPDYLVAMLGLILIVNSLISFTRFQIPAPSEARETAWSVFFAGTGGVMFGMTGNFIVPGILFLQALKLKRDVMVQTLGVTLLTISSAMAVSFTSRSMMNETLTIVSAASLIPAFAGLWLGTRYRHSISEQQFRKLFFAGLLVIGCVLIFGAIRNIASL